MTTSAGTEFDLGTTETTPTIGITDYSRRVTDDFGTTTVVERGFARRMTVRMALPSTSVDAVQQTLADLRASSAQWVADERFAWLSVNGFYKEFDLDLSVGALSFCRLTVEGLAETEVVADPGGDPATPGEASTLRLLQPVSIAGGALVSSNVAENDYPAWVSGTTYAKSARVISAADYRIYESITGGNVGNDPVSSLGDWIDVGPTNRWAMFDQALGTATTAISPIVVTLAPGAIGAIALLDVLGSTVRVQATGYDRTLPVGGGSILFLDLPANAGQITVTIAGNVMVSVGTLLAGKVVSLGVTEASPTAGITDYSRKTTDDFGTMTVVERAWAKRMNVRAMIRTDAVDLVANRIAAVRARPSLWIGDTGSDSLTIYGFFRDFSIEVGEATSRLSLSIEGLSKAPSRRSPGRGLSEEQLAKIEAIQDLLDGTVQFFLSATQPSGGVDPGNLLLEDGASFLLFEDGVSLLAFEAGGGAGSASEGDIWYNPDTGEWRRLEAGAWILKDGFGVLGEALLKAAGAEALSDGKATVFYSNSEPTGADLGDLWMRQTGADRTLRVWNGTEWELVSEVGADITITVSGPKETTLPYDSTGTVLQGEGVILRYSLASPSGVVAGGADSASYRVFEGSVNGRTVSSPAQPMTIENGAALLPLTASAALTTPTGRVVVTLLRNGKPYQETLILNRELAPMPVASGGSSTGGSSGGTSGGSSGSSTQSSGFAQLSSASFVPVSANLGYVLPEGKTEAILSNALSFRPNREGNAGAWLLEGKWQRNVGTAESPVWSDVGGVFPAQSELAQEEPGVSILVPTPGTMNGSRTATGLASGSEHTFRFVARISDGTLRTHSVFGSAGISS